MTTIMTHNQALKKNDEYESATLRTTTMTITTGNFSAPFKPILKTTPKVNHTENVSIKNDGIHFSKIMKDSLKYLKKMFGLTPDCRNGGIKTSKGECICPKFYRGDLCEELVCVNNGTLVKLPKLTPAQYTCRCPHPEYIHGQHCEYVKCLNGGRPMDNGHCKCLDSWYTGQFCQEYAASWGVVLGLPLLCLVIIIICCIVCRLDLFPRKPVHPRRRRRALLNGVCGESVGHRHREMEMRRGSNRTGSEIYLRMQENLLNDNNDGTLVLRPYRYFLPSYTIELNAIPALNPVSSANANWSKPFDPPPSYEEAVAKFSTSQQPITRAISGTLPPEYTSSPYPLLPPSQSCNISRNS